MRSRLSVIVTCVACCVLCCLLGIASPAHAAGGFGQPVTGQHVYDRANVLAPADITALEQHAASVVAAGAPVAVYLQAQAATYDQTLQDASDLMDDWNIQSTPNARDGVVIFFNLTPGNLHHGQVALFAGAQQYQGNLPQAELQRIYQDVMLPDLRAGDIAASIGDALDAIASDLRNGPPAPAGPDVRGLFLASLPWNGAALLILLAVVAVYVRTVHKLQLRRTTTTSVTQPPNDLPSAIVGALVQGRIKDQQMQATIIDLGQRGALIIEPGGLNTIQVRLLDEHQTRAVYEKKLWNDLKRIAGAGDIIAAGNLAQASAHWSDAKNALRQDLENRGWYATDPGARRQPLYLAGWLVVFAIGAGSVLTLVAGNGWGCLGLTILLGAAIFAFCAGAALPDTTPAGEGEAAVWRGYLAGLHASQYEPGAHFDLETAITIAIAAGVGATLQSLLYKASAQGFLPLWISPDQADHHTLLATWSVFQSSFAPVTTGSAGGYHGGFSGGGAAGGGGGAGGSF